MGILESIFGNGDETKRFRKLADTSAAKLRSSSHADRTAALATHRRALEDALHERQLELDRQKGEAQRAVAAELERAELEAETARRRAETAIATRAIATLTALGREWREGVDEASKPTSARATATKIASVIASVAAQVALETGEERLSMECIVSALFVDQVVERDARTLLRFSTQWPEALRDAATGLWKACTKEPAAPLEVVHELESVERAVDGTAQWIPSGDVQPHHRELYEAARGALTHRTRTEVRRAIDERIGAERQREFEATYVPPPAEPPLRHMNGSDFTDIVREARERLAR